MSTTLTYFIIIAFLVAVSSLLSSTSDVIDKTKKGIKSVTKKGWILLVLNLSIIIFSVLQYRQNDIEVKQKENEANYKQIQRDSLLRNQYDSSLYIMKQKYDSSHLNIVRTIANALGMYGFKLDSSNQRLEKLIKDSSKTRIIMPDDPVLIICPDGGIKLVDSKLNSHHYKIDFCSQTAGSSQFEIKCRVVLSDSMNSYTYAGSFDMPSDLQIPKDMVNSEFFDIVNNQSYSFLYILVKGKYKNIDGTKSFQVNTLYYYNRYGNTSGMITGDTRRAIINYLDSSHN